MKKIIRITIISAVMITALIMGATAVSASTVDSGTCGDNLTWTLDDKGNLKISGTGAIDDGAFAYSLFTDWQNKKDGNVVIGDGVTGIGEDAFGGADFKGTLKIGKNVKYIEDFAFSGCKFKGKLTLPSGMKTIGLGAFKNCKKFTGTLTIPKSVKSIDSYAFTGCSGLKKVVFKGKNTEIEEYAFVGTKAISPQKAVIKAVKGCNGTVSVTWKKQSANTDGYIVEITDYDDTFELPFMDGITHVLKGKTKTSYKFKNLDSGTYYVHVTAYKKIGNQRITGYWSTTRKILLK